MIGIQRGDFQHVEGAQLCGDSTGQFVVLQLEKAETGQFGNVGTDSTGQLVVVQVECSEVGKGIEFFGDGTLEQVEVEINLSATNKRSK